MLFRLLKAILLAATAVVVVAALAAFLWVERQARVLAHDATAPWGSALHWQSTGVSLTPPGVALSSVRLDGADGKPLFRAARCVLPLAPGAVTGHGPKTSTPRCEDWQATLSPEAAGRRSPTWTRRKAGSPSRSATRAGPSTPLRSRSTAARSPSAAASTNVRARFISRGRSRTAASRRRLPSARSTPCRSRPGSSPPPKAAPAVRLGLDGELVARAGRLSLTGTLAADDLMVEGTGVSSLEKAIRLRGSSAHLPIALSAPLEGADWPAAVRRLLGG